jgi:hypothetical protein
MVIRMGMSCGSAGSRSLYCWQFPADIDMLSSHRISPAIVTFLRLRVMLGINGDSRPSPHFPKRAYRHRRLYHSLLRLRPSWTVLDAYTGWFDWFDWQCVSGVEGFCRVICMSRSRPRHPCQGFTYRVLAPASVNPNP